jgi:HEAT repeat protein
VNRSPAFLLALALMACGGGDGDEDVTVTAQGNQLAGRTARLVRAMEQDADGSSGELVEALARVADRPKDDALPYLVTLTDHEDEEVRFNVVMALKAVGGEQARAALAVMAEEDDSDLVRHEAGEN